MSDKKNSFETNNNPVINYALQLLALSVLLVWCFKIIEPFITPLVWGMVLAVSLLPLHQSLTKRINGKAVLSASIITISMVLLFIGPAVWLLFSSVGEVKDITVQFREGQLTVPPPDVKVKDWPLIGDKLFVLWTEASEGIGEFIELHKDQVRSFALSFIGLLGTTAKGIMLFLLSIIISGVLLVYEKEVRKTISALFIRIAGKYGDQLGNISGATIKSVVKGILGVAVIQSMLAGLGLVLAGIPFAGVWTVICLVLSIVQVGIFPVSIGTIIYVWGTSDTVTSVIFTIWMVLVGLVDNVLKPIMLGKGAPAPMLIVFIGSIGGFLLSGLIGLFTGAIVLTIGYKMFSIWIKFDSEEGLEGSLDNA